MKRLLIAGLLALGMAGAGLWASTTSGADTATLNFNDAAQMVELTVPDPPCVANGCQWELQVDNPTTNVVYGSGSAGTAGVIIDVPYPTDFCGTIQADVFVLDNETGAPHLQFGHRKDISTCESTTTTTTIGCPPNDTPPPCSVPTTQVTTPIPSAVPTPSSPAPSSSVVTPTTVPNPNQLPPIAPEQNGVTNGNG